MENGDHGDLTAHVQELVEVESRAPPGCVIDQSMFFAVLLHQSIMKVLQHNGFVQNKMKLLWLHNFFQNSNNQIPVSSMFEKRDKSRDSKMQGAFRLLLPRIHHSHLQIYLKTYFGKVFFFFFFLNVEGLFKLSDTFSRLKAAK